MSSTVFGRYMSSKPSQRPSTVFGRYMSLSGRTRIFLGLIGMLFSGAGLYFSDPSREAELAARKAAARQIAPGQR